MYLINISHYIPEQRVSNSFFEKTLGVSSDWLVQRTGIETRSRANEGENSNTMAVEAVRNGLDSLPFDASEIDLIVAASYTPYDLIYTLGHEIQREFDMNNAKVVFVSTACSSLVNALEIVEGYMAMGKSKKALVIASEHNTMYSEDNCAQTSHLWGDGASAMFFSNEPIGEKCGKVLNIYTKGLGSIGHADTSVKMVPTADGLIMPNGRDVFIHAVSHMIEGLNKVLKHSGYSLSDLDYLIPHQANQRIIANMQKQINLPLDKVFTNIKYLGNTGCASTGICLSENIDTISSNSLVGITVFGGGYSMGAVLIQF